MPSTPKAQTAAAMVEVRGKHIRPDPALIFGEGGEAVVYDVSSFFSPEQLALKLWKPPEHPDYAGSTDKAVKNRKGARMRLATYGKKLRAFPDSLPTRVVKPLALATNPLNKRVIGYLMQKISGAQPLMRMASREDRESFGLGLDDLLQSFLDLHETVRQVHAADVVIGDFNYANVLIHTGKLEAYLIDADSFQFRTSTERFPCTAFTPRFVDPLICDPQATRMIQKRLHSAETDWYAFSLMLFECVMSVPLYGGSYTVKRGEPAIPHEARPLKGISVFHPGVIYPGPTKATPLSWLPSRVRGYFEDLTAPGKDLRGEFPRDFLEILLACSKGSYVDPSAVTPAAAIQQVIRGKVRWTKVFKEEGTVLAAQIDGSTLRYLYHHDNTYRREGRQVVLQGPYDPAYRLRILGESTVVGKGDQIVILRDGTTPTRFLVSQYQGTRQIFDTNNDSLVWCRGDGLYRMDGSAQANIGPVLENQTLVWLGPTFGFGFYRIDGYQVGFVFDPRGRGLRESAKLPPLRGELVDAYCSLTPYRCWFFATLRFNGVMTNVCIVLNDTGEVVAHHEAREGESWLSGARGKAVATFGGGSKPIRHALFAATDHGLAVLEERTGDIVVTAALPDTEDFVAPTDTLIYDPNNGLYVANRRSIGLLTLG